MAKDKAASSRSHRVMFGQFSLLFLFLQIIGGIEVISIETRHVINVHEFEQRFASELSKYLVTKTVSPELHRMVKTLENTNETIFLEELPKATEVCAHF